jgi:RsiW-degrading membrane proteinase PrsW (M82 family)
MSHSIPTLGIALESPLRRPAVARRTAMALGLLLLVAAGILCLVVGGLGSEAARVFLRALALSSALSVVPIAILWYLDRRERETPALFAAAFLWGGLIATTYALPLNTAVLQAVAGWLEHNAGLMEMLGPEAALMIGAPLAAPIVEETTKGIGILLLFWLMRGEFDNTRDGFIYGALVGAGFNWFESALYVQQNFAQFGTAPFGFQLGARYAWLGLAGHAMFSGIFGAAVGYARVTSRRWWGALVALAGFLAAMLAHAWNNGLPLLFAIVQARAGKAPPTEVEAPPALGLFEAMWQSSISNLVIFLPFVILLVWILRKSGERERRVIREELADEVGGAVTAQEYQAILADKRFHTRRIDGRDAATSKALIAAQHELAFRKRRLKLRDHAVADDPVLVARRAQIAGLRQRLQA